MQNSHKDTSVYVNDDDDDDGVDENGTHGSHHKLPCILIVLGESFFRVGLAFAPRTIRTPRYAQIQRASAPCRQNEFSHNRVRFDTVEVTERGYVCAGGANSWKQGLTIRYDPGARQARESN